MLLRARWRHYCIYRTAGTHPHMPCVHLSFSLSLTPGAAEKINRTRKFRVGRLYQHALPKNNSWEHAEKSHWLPFGKHETTCSNSSSYVPISSSLCTHHVSLHMHNTIQKDDNNPKPDPFGRSRRRSYKTQAICSCHTNAQAYPNSKQCVSSWSILMCNTGSS